MEPLSKYGFIPSQIIEDEHYILGDGCLPSDVIMPDGHGWGAYLPKAELQAKNGIETNNCTNYGTLHAIATLGKKKFGDQFQTDLSERFLGVVSGTGTFGNDPHWVCEAVRKFGCIPEVYLPFDGIIKTRDQYFSPKPMRQDLLKIGTHWLQKYAFGHDWVFNGGDIADKQIRMKEALKYSPLAGSVYAWAQRADGLYYKLGMDNHWITIFDYVDNLCWMIFDSYDQSVKKLAWDFDFGQVKRFSLKLQPNFGADGSGLLSRIFGWLGFEKKI